MSALLGIAKAALWPEANLVEMLIKDEKDKPTPPVCTPIPSFTEHVAYQASMVPKIIIGVLAWKYTVDIAAAKTFAWSWIWPILLRDFAISFVAGGMWDYIVYSSMFRNKLTKYKFNPTYPPHSQMTRDMMWSLCSTLISSIIEIVLAHMWATHKVKIYTDFWQYPYWSLLWLCGIPYWRLSHFFCIHRVMHPWRVSWLPDVGKVLYRYVHSLHHKSYNPTAWSGISMHPVESSLYYSAALLPSLFVCHPLHFLVTKVDLTVGALVGHDGFATPGGGSYYHYIHHAHFEVNYGDKIAPLDWLFGCYGDGTKKQADDEKAH